MQQIADWLQKLGLGQYAHRFAENDISFPLCPINHTIVPTRNKSGSGAVFCTHFCLRADPKGDHFAPVRISDTLTLLFDDYEEFDSHHYAFHVSDPEFDAIFGCIREAKLAYRSAPRSLDDGKLNDWNGGRGVYFRDHDGHVPELMTVPQ